MKQLQQLKVISRRLHLLLNPLVGNQLMAMAKRKTKASSSKNVHMVEEEVMENPEFLDDLSMNSDDNGDDDAAEGPPMGTGITSRFNISHEHLQ